MKAKFITLLGIIIAILGFLISSSKNLPFVQALFISDYTHGVSAFEKLINGDHVIKEGDIGFDVLAQLISSRLTGPKSIDLKINKIINQGNCITFSSSEAETGATLKIFYTNNNQTGEIELLSSRLKIWLEEIGEKQLFIIGLILFIFGGVIIPLYLAFLDNSINHNPARSRRL